MRVLVLVGLALGPACSLVVAPDPETLADPPRTCDPGEVVQCACVGGVFGMQRCNDGGSFDPCACGVAGAGG